MKYRKIRGQKKIWKDIEEWKNYNLELDLDYLQHSQRNYAKIWVSPFCDIAITNSEIPEPKGTTRKRILESLLDIHDSWQEQLKTLNKPYYLNIWLYEQRFKRSQVVCAIGDCLNFYDNTFYKPEEQKVLATKNFGSLQERIEDFNWTYAYDDNKFSSDDVLTPADEYVDVENFKMAQKWYKNQLKKPLREFSEGTTKYYSVKHGDIWLGNSKSK